MEEGFELTNSYTMKAEDQEACDSWEVMSEDSGSSTHNTQELTTFQFNIITTADICTNCDFLLSK